MKILTFCRKYPLVIVTILAVIPAVLLAVTHPASARISFDEGFHGGAAQFVRELVLYKLGLSHERPTFLLGEFFNGIAIYPPTWNLVAGGLGLVFGASVTVFRFATSLFYIATIVFTFWLVLRASGRTLHAFIAAAVLATIPTVMVYSHLMMLELPLLLGVTAAVGCYYLYTADLLKRNWQTVFWLMLVFGFGVLTKVAAIYVIWGTIFIYAGGASLLFWKQRYYRKFLKPETLLFLAASVAALGIFIVLEERYLHFSLIQFHLKQSQDIATSLGLPTKGNFLVRTLGVLWERRHYYLRDMLHMPHLMWLWLLSPLVYAVWKRTPFAETEAAALLAQRAHRGDRVVTWNDGVTFAVRNLGYSQDVQIKNGLQQICPAALMETYDWAVGTAGDPAHSVLDTTVFAAKPWEEVARFGEGGVTVLYHNSSAAAPLTIEGESYGKELSVADPAAHNGSAIELTDKLSQPSIWGCYRLLPLGTTTARFFMSAPSVDATLPDAEPVVKIEYSGYPQGEQTEKIVTAGELRAHPTYTPYTLTIHHEKLDLAGEFRAYVLRPATVRLDRIELAQ